MWLGDFALMTDIQPAGVEDPGPFGFEHLGIDHRRAMDPELLVLAVVYDVGVWHVTSPNRNRQALSDRMPAFSDARAAAVDAS